MQVQEFAAYAMTMQSLAQSGNWLTGGNHGTLTREALDAVLGTCEELGDRPRLCAPKIINRFGPFAGMNDAAAKEAVLLLRQCKEEDLLEDCRTNIEDERYIRNQDIGLAKPNTLKMQQFEQVIWSVAIHRSQLQVVPGSALPIDNATQTAGGEGSGTVGNAISFTESTCFELEYKASEFKVEQDRVCPEYQRGNVPYTAKWEVTPLKSGQLQLWVTATHERGGRPLRPETVPTSPFEIEVESWIDLWASYFTSLAGLATAVGTLMAAIGGWAVWKLFKRREGSANAP